MTVHASPTRILSPWAFALIVMALGLGQPAQAQTSKQSAERARAVEMAQATEDAGKLVVKYGLPCEVVEASSLGETDAIKDGKKLTVNTYEVSCKNLQGFLLTEYKNAPFGDPISCLQAQTLNKANPAAPTCRLKSNRAAHYWLGDTAKSKIPACQIAGARWIGPDNTKEKEIFEISCKALAGGIFIVPTYKAADKTVGFYNCLKVEGTAMACQNTPHELAAQFLSPQVKKNVPACTLSDARYVGGTQEAEYYEVGCKDKPGFVMVTTLDTQFKATVGCDKASAIGGCKFTDVAAMGAEKKAQKDAALTAFADTLNKASVACTVEDFNRLGRHEDSKRDVVEFKCPEHNLGLVAYVPAAGSAATLDTYDCFAAKTLGLQCLFVGDAQLLNHLQNLIAGHKSIKSDCQLSQARYAFMSTTGVIVMELACVNKRGYIGVLNKARTVINPAVPCHIAATSDKVPEKCTLAGNGSNKSE
jgi:hypothetical protein